MAGSASTWRLTVTSGGTGKPAKRLDVLERRQRLRRRPRQRAAEGTAADTQRHGQQVVAAVLQARTGEAHEHAALFDPGLHLSFDVAGQRADVGEHQDRRVLLQRGIDTGREVGVLRLDELGERRQRLLDVVERRQQRLRLLAGFRRK